jgi:hypothetical protein
VTTTTAQPSGWAVVDTENDPTWEETVV